MGNIIDIKTRKELKIILKDDKKELKELVENVLKRNNKNVFVLSWDANLSKEGFFIDYCGDFDSHEIIGILEITKNKMIKENY